MAKFGGGRYRSERVGKFLVAGALGHLGKVVTSFFEQPIECIEV